jgi:UDP-4-amino-4-deoxy-L-arabinose formyltransferase/UDP-glucuronic acid dehydrogenase (UDP-4-keto-hexauronic acid decarboxylating)
LRVLDARLVSDPIFAARVASDRIDLILNVHSVRNPDPGVLAAPRIGSFNMHPGPLPTYAGFNAPSWAIAAGEEHYAVTVHWMVAEMDAGPIAYEARFEIGEHDTGLRVATRCVAEGIPLLARLIDDAEAGEVPSRPQDPEGWSFTWYDVPYGGRLPWEARARRVVDLVRAADYAPYASPWGTFATVVGGDEVAIVRAALTGEGTDAPPGTIGPARGEAVAVSAGDEWVLVERCRIAGEDVPPCVALVAGRRCEVPEKPLLGGSF